MKTKTIEKILRGKFAQFLRSIKNERVQKLVRENTIITGGAIVSLCLNEEVNDFDLYFTNKETVLAVADYYKGIIAKDKSTQDFKVIDEDVDSKTSGRVKLLIKSSGVIKTNKDKKFHPVVITDNAISLSNDIQLIVRFYGDAKEIHKNFDFDHVKSYWLSRNGKLYLNIDSIEAILAKELRYSGSLYPLASFFRLRKFLTRGWTITAGDIFKIAFQVSKLDFTDPAVLYDQLIGVDIHYFKVMIDRIERDLKDGNIKRSDITGDYLSDLIDEIFHSSGDYDITNYDDE